MSRTVQVAQWGQSESVLQFSLCEGNTTLLPCTNKPVTTNRSKSYGQVVEQHIYSSGGKKKTTKSSNCKPVLRKAIVFKPIFTIRNIPWPGQCTISSSTHHSLLNYFKKWYFLQCTFKMYAFLFIFKQSWFTLVLPVCFLSLFGVTPEWTMTKTVQIGEKVCI